MPATLPELPDDIDRKALRTVRSRFRAIGEARLARVRALLGEQDRMFIDVLPLLLHVNHPGLPGYVSQNTPHGVSDYRPGRETLAIARQLARSFTARPGPAAEPGVHAIYLMGSTGTLGHSDASDLDIWVCYPESLDPESLARLQRKAELLHEWARGLGVDTQLFLMNGEKFRRGQREPLTGENCGTAQHYLLLDEFYRTGILLAGRHPAWWLVPPQHEHDYTAYLAELARRRNVGTQEVVDFGGIHRVPAGEYVGAGIWQLYKAIDSPHKSALKLLLFEVYAAHFPEPVCLSGDYKRSVYAGVTDIDELDPYVMIYRRLEEHLQRAGQPERLELVRRCFYYKAGEKLSRPLQRGAPSWHRDLMERLTTEWGWDRAELARLDSRAGWHIHEVVAERNALVRELMLSYRFLSEFAREGDAAASIDARELGILGRKLYAAHERRAGKVETLQFGADRRVAESELSICTVGGRADDDVAAQWGVYPEIVAPRERPVQKPLRQAACLAELLAWCAVNGIVGADTRLAVRETLDGLHRVELDAMLREIRERIVPARAGAVLDDAAFAAPARTLSLLVFVNVAADPLQPTGEHGVQRVSSRTDSLDYSARRDNLVLNLETLVCNSWGEIIAARYAGEDGLIRCARDFLQMGDLDPADVAIRCFCSNRAAAIAARIGELFADLRDVFRPGAGHVDARYVLAIGTRLHLLRQQQDTADARVADSPDALLELLGASQRQWSPLVVDRHALRDSVLPALAPCLAPGQISVFCESRADGLQVIVGDECGSLFRCVYAGLREASALGALVRFLVSVGYRRNGAVHAGAAMLSGPETLRVYRLVRERRAGEYSAVPLHDLPRGDVGALHVQAIAEHGPGHGRVLYTVWCEGQSFCQRELGAEFAPALASHIRSRRAGQAGYPVYLTDLDLSAIEAAEPAPFQTVHYLRHRQALETLINASLRTAR